MRQANASEAEVNTGTLGARLSGDKVLVVALAQKPVKGKTAVWTEGREGGGFFRAFAQCLSPDITTITTVQREGKINKSKLL